MSLTCNIYLGTYLQSKFLIRRIRIWHDFHTKRLARYRKQKGYKFFYQNPLLLISRELIIFYSIPWKLYSYFHAKSEFVGRTIDMQWYNVLF